MAPLIKFAIAAFALHDKTSNRSGVAVSRLPLQGTATNEDSIDLSKLLPLFGATPVNLLSLRTDPSTGIRGVYLKDAVEEGDILLQMPLSSCLRDDAPPDWFQQNVVQEEELSYSLSVEGWVTRLAACLLDAQINQEKLNEAMQEWLNLLPTNLRDILPIHWDESDVRMAQCRQLELAIDSAFFARAGPIADLMNSNRNLTKRQVEDALDLVQTRSCRAESSGGHFRVLIPIFDLINHNRDNNAEFSRENDNMVVRALRDTEKGAEVFINYGAATVPAWKCLFSYGFVPFSDDIYEDDVAELLLDGVRFEVGPVDIPFELVQYEAERFGSKSEDKEEVEFTPKIGRAIVTRLVDAAKQIETRKVQTKNQMALQLITDLNKSSRRTMLACAGGLSEYIEGEENSS